ncbi:SdpI family protein [Clostridium butyricum]|uniref:SdpI family protein n=1 Tax=Clostridium butyricum TaxID=1492 RepID=UPI000416115E|nr:SdpI family protein [Clostridium butyricum]
MYKKKSDIYNVIIIVCSILLTIIVYNKLPDLVPTHWNTMGEIDKYSPKAFGAFMAPVIMIFTWSGMKFLPKIDPRKKNYEKFDKSYSVIVSILLTFFLVIHAVTLLAALGYGISIEKIIPLIVGVLFIVIGNYLPKSKSNFFYGIKTLWTLSSEVSWRKTHRLGGKLFVVAGIVCILSSFLLNGNIKAVVFFIAIMIAAIVPIVASYFYAKNDKEN